MVLLYSAVVVRAWARTVEIENNRGTNKKNFLILVVFFQRYNLYKKIAAVLKRKLLLKEIQLNLSNKKT